MRLRTHVRALGTTLVALLIMALWAPLKSPLAAKPAGRQAVAAGQTLTVEQRQAIDAAVPARAPAVPARPRRLLVITLQMRNGSPVEGPSFAALPAQNYALELMGRRTGAFEAVISNDMELLRPGRINQFDAICFCNSLGVLFDDPELRQSLLDFVAGGKGLVGIHDGLATFVQWPQYDQWPEFGRMLGGTENGGHPWDGEMVIRVEDRTSPLTAMFGESVITVRDQAFQLQEPSLRDRLHVLLSIDADRMPAPRRPFFPTRREDRDFPMSWIKPHGQGRVFFSAFGHSDFIFWNPQMLAHLLAGIQYALGDLPADDRPSGLAR
jgi:type 1 glutamine amidotransferase